MVVQGLDDQFCPNTVQIADRDAYYRFLLLCVHCEFTIEAANLRYNVQGKQEASSYIRREPHTRYMLQPRAVFKQIPL